jgi:hypothetical protein
LSPWLSWLLLSASSLVSTEASASTSTAVAVAIDVASSSADFLDCNPPLPVPLTACCQCILAKFLVYQCQPFQLSQRYIAALYIFVSKSPVL